MFAFEDTWSLLHTQSQKLRFIERFCEFVTATFYGNNNLFYTIQSDFVPPSKLNEETLLINCLSPPGFWGHILIALASILKHKSQLPLATFNILLLNLHEKCFWVFEDESARLVIRSMTEPKILPNTLALSCRNLLLGRKNNLHQITLAESIVYLFREDLVKDLEKARLIDVLVHYADS
ncbi:hypothetical protein [Shewanella sp. NIFS-20-20]|uniref:hypothetical protein n=1 Tax=Shewanella sp. NIFS-20-20 TaxID=2853806 RepID=UPI001C4799D4|nr:hypothetical protein [Shewanella sp. NIFS-20-20]MBV7317618.1 hypothetical protein [Shewanella sp. NIFS-20-20]